MKFNSEPVCEIDIRASYLTIFHAWHGEPLNAGNDPYDVEPYGPAGRDVVKMWITGTFGNMGPLERWPRELVAKYLERTGEKLGQRYPISEVGKAVLRRFPVLTQLQAKKRGWAELMYAESEAVLKTMISLMDKNIPSLAVHDSIIVPVSKSTVAMTVLRENYQETTTAIPELVVHNP
jgi:hypothetical protein